MKKGNILIIALVIFAILGIVTAGYFYLKNNNKFCGGLVANFPEYQCPFPFACKQLKGNYPDAGGTCVLISKNPEPLVNLPYPKTAPNLGSETSTTSTDPTTNWKTYTNTKYNYEIKYPSDWTVGVMNSSDNINFSSLVNFRKASDQTPAESGYIIAVMSPENLLVSQICQKNGQYTGGASAQGFLCGKKILTNTKIMNGINWEVLDKDSVGYVPSGQITHNTIHNSKLYFVISFSGSDETYFYDQILSTLKFL